MIKAAVAAGAVLALIGVATGSGHAQGPAPAEDEKAVIEQNLFHPSRSVPPPPPPPAPPAPAPVAAPPPPPPAPKFVLSGVVIAGESGTAILQEPDLTQNKPRLVSRGQQVGPYRLTDLQWDRATLRGPAGEVVVLLHDPNKPKPSLVAARQQAGQGQTFAKSLREALRSRGQPALAPRPPVPQPAKPDEEAEEDEDAQLQAEDEPHPGSGEPPVREDKKDKEERKREKQLEKERRHQEKRAKQGGGGSE